jgi:CheY-like chemotaxis protein
MNADRALLICDDSGLLDRLSETVERVGYRVDRMIRGTGAMALLQRSSYAMVVLVHPMGDTPTSDLLAAVRHQESPSRTASVVVLTAMDRSQDTEALRKVGANEVVPLSTSAEGLEATLQRLREVAPRKGCRVALRLRGASSAAAKQLFCQSANLSKSGALVRGRMPWQVGDIVVFELGVAGQKPICGRAEIVRLTTRAERDQGFALTFRDFDGDGELRLAAYLDAVPEPEDAASSS